MESEFDGTSSDVEPGVSPSWSAAPLPAPASLRVRPSGWVVAGAIVVYVSAAIWSALFLYWMYQLSRMFGTPTARDSTLLVILGVTIVGGIAWLVVIQSRGVFGCNLTCAAMSSGVTSGLGAVCLLVLLLFTDDLGYMTDSLSGMVWLAAFITFAAGMCFSSMVTFGWSNRLLTLNWPPGLDEKRTSSQFSFRSMMLGMTVISVAMVFTSRIHTALVHLPSFVLGVIAVLCLVTILGKRVWHPPWLANNMSLPMRTDRFAVWLTGMLGTLMGFALRMLPSPPYDAMSFGYSPDTLPWMEILVAGCRLANAILVGVAVAGTVALLLGCQLSRWFTLVWLFVGSRLVTLMVLGPSLSIVYYYSWLVTLGVTGSGLLLVARGRWVLRGRSRAFAARGCLLGMVMGGMVTLRFFEPDRLPVWEYPVLVTAVLMTTAVMGLFAAEFGRAEGEMLGAE